MIKPSAMIRQSVWYSLAEDILIIAPYYGIKGYIIVNTNRQYYFIGVL